MTTPGGKTVAVRPVRRNGQGRSKSRGPIMWIHWRRDILTTSESNRRRTDESLSFRRKYFSRLVIDVWDSRISHIYSFKCRKLVLVISSYFSRVSFLFLLFLSFPFVLSIFVSFSVWFSYYIYLCYDSNLCCRICCCRALLDDYFLLIEKRKDHASDYIYGRNRETPVEGNRRFEVCVFVYLEADCPRDIETSKIRRKTSRSKNTSVVDVFATEVSTYFSSFILSLTRHSLTCCHCRVCFYRYAPKRVLTCRYTRRKHRSTNPL